MAPPPAARPPPTQTFAQSTVAGALMKIDEDGFIAFDEDADMREGARNVIEFAQAIMRHACIVHMPHNGLPATVRVGVHTGSVVRCVAAGSGRRCLGALGAREIAGANGLAPTAVHTHQPLICGPVQPHPFTEWMDGWMDGWIMLQSQVHLAAGHATSVHRN